MNWKKFLKSKAPRLLVLVIVAAIIVGAVVGALGGRAGFLTDLDGILREPFQQASVTFTGWLESLYGNIYRYDSLLAENQRLREDLAAAQAEAREGREAVQENERLRDLLDLSQRHSDFELESAKVVASSASNWSSIITISKGEEAGIEPGDCVITEGGSLVGQVMEVGSGWATVRTVIDIDLSAGGYVSNSGATGMITGDFSLMQEGKTKLGYLMEGVSLFPGDTVLTSGKGGAYPAGLVVGTIEEVRTAAGGQQTFGVIEPACDLGNLLQVFIIKDFEVVE
ncbi:MAG: rod shape-determining protein MreC [Oscillospiraceae bacterium]|nr:rod shape-determining protein MreC [Oscillospiraceae bacterium]